MGKINTSVAGAKKYCAVDKAVRLVYLYIKENYSSTEVEIINKELRDISRQEDFSFYGNASIRYTYAQVQDALSKINEKQSIRKSNGVYYTPNDVVRFILTNSIRSLFGKLNVKNMGDMSLENILYWSFCCNKTVFDQKLTDMIQFNKRCIA